MAYNKHKILILKAKLMYSKLKLTFKIKKITLTLFREHVADTRNDTKIYQLAHEKLPAVCSKF